MNDWKTAYAPWFGSGTDFYRQAIEALNQAAVPDQTQEQWRYTRLHSLFGNNRPVRSEYGTVPNADADSITWIDGQLTSSRFHGLQIESLSTVLADTPAFLSRFPAPVADLLAGLTDAIHLNEYVIRIPNGFHAPKPIRLLFLQSPAGSGCLTPVKLWIVAGTGSECTLIEDYQSAGGSDYLRTVNVRIQVERQARLNHVRLQSEAVGACQVNRTDVAVMGAAGYQSWVITTHGDMVRNQLQVNLEEPGAETVLRGLSLATGSGQVENLTLIEHRQPHTHSQEIYKGILAGTASVVFDGRIVVQPGAIKITANQSNRSLLLSDQAQANSKPQLEIYADDVKCYHGATVGQLDEQQVFYLQARGISRDLAAAMLTQAFAMDILSSLPDPVLLEDLSATIETRVQGMFIP